MKRFSILFLISLLISACNPQTMKLLTDTLGASTGSKALTNTDVISGLKEALTIGTINSVLSTSKEDGFLKNALIAIPFPESAQKVKDALLKIGMSNQISKFETSLNRAAEEASKGAKDIFVAAVKDMTIQDGFQILNGGKTAATDYLRTKTTDALKAKFTPVIKSAIEKVNVTSYWSPLVNAYNLIPGVQKQNPNLEEYITDKTINGLMTMIASEEQKIRENPAARVTEILQKVFGSVAK